MEGLPEIPDSEKTPLALTLLEVIKQQAQEIQLLKEEIARLKNRPGKPKLQPWFNPLKLDSLLS